MIVTGAFLAEAAAAVDGKLHVWGGVIDNYFVNESRTVETTLVVLTQAEAGDTQEQLEIEVHPPAGAMPENEQAPVIRMDFPEAAFSGENGFAFWKVQLGAPVDGRYVLMVGAAGNTVAVPLMVSS